MTTRMRSMWQSLKTTANNVREFMAGAMRRIFGVSDDDYPATGVQPFEGEPTKDKHF